MAKPKKTKYVPPKVGDTYTTHQSKVTGKIEEIVPNKTGTSRIRLKLEDGADRWTTHIPESRKAVFDTEVAPKGTNERKV
jgi:hypothetical protein